MNHETSMNVPAQPARRKALVSGFGVGAASLFSGLQVTRPRHAAIGEMWIMPTEQSGKA
jgi:hypothetical protein